MAVRGDKAVEAPGSSLAGRSPGIVGGCGREGRASGDAGVQVARLEVLDFGLGVDEADRQHGRIECPFPIRIVLLCAALKQRLSGTFLTYCLRLGRAFLAPLAMESALVGEAPLVAQQAPFARVTPALRQRGETRPSRVTHAS